MLLINLQSAFKRVFCYHLHRKNRDVDMIIAAKWPSLLRSPALLPVGVARRRRIQLIILIIVLGGGRLGSRLHPVQQRFEQLFV